MDSRLTVTRALPSGITQEWLRRAASVEDSSFDSTILEHFYAICERIESECSCVLFAQTRKILVSCPDEVFTANATTRFVVKAIARASAYTLSGVSYVNTDEESIDLDLEADDHPVMTERGRVIFTKPTDYLAWPDGIVVTYTPTVLDFKPFEQVFHRVLPALLLAVNEPKLDQRIDELIHKHYSGL